MVHLFYNNNFKYFVTHMLCYIYFPPMLSNCGQRLAVVCKLLQNRSGPIYLTISNTC